MQNSMIDSNRQELFGLAVNPDVLFADHKNVYRQKVEKRQRKLLRKIAFIAPFLHENETILCVTTGCSPVSAVEQFLTGWIVFYLKRSLFVLTNERILHIPTKHDFSYRDSIAQILYADCRRISVRGRNLVAEYKNGTKEKFICIPGSERKKIKVLLDAVSADGQPSPNPCRTHLCPRCASPLVEGRYTCPGCSLEFKSKQRARRNSIIFPGGGYFYAGHPLLGVGDALVEAYLTILVIAALAAAVSGEPGSVGALVVFAIVLAMEKAVSVYHSNHFVKEFIPKDRQAVTHTENPVPQQPSGEAEPKPEEILSASWNGRREPAEKAKIRT